MSCEPFPMGTAARRNDLDTATSERPARRFMALQEICALMAIEIFRTNPDDGPVQVVMRCNGACHLFWSIEDAADFIDHQTQHDHHD